MIKAIICVDKQGAIGQNGDMPWGRSFPEDLAYFKRVTLYQDVVVGRTTYESLPFNRKGFPQRDTLVLTSGNGGAILGDGEAVYFMSKGELLDVINDSEYDIWIAGGSTVYEQFWNLIDEVHITTIDNIYPEADTFFQVDLTNFEDTLQCTQVGNGDIDAEVRVYRRKV